MQIPHRQRGMTMWGLLFVLGVIAFTLFLVFKLLPPYLSDLKVRAALDSLVRQPDAGAMGKAEIMTALYKRFDIDNVTHVKLETDLSIEARDRNKVIRIRYEAVVPMAYNISALLEFDHAREVRAE
jgi:hypothetical protein